MTVFDRDLKRRQRDRAFSADDSDMFEYLRNEIAARVVDRLSDIKMKFPEVLDYGCGTGAVARNLDEMGVGGVKRLHQVDYSEKAIEINKKQNAHISSFDQDYSLLVREEDDLPLAKNSVDLAISSMHLHWINDLPGTLARVRQTLKPNGCFLGAMLGGETLQELRSAFALADTERLGGVSPHVSPFVRVKDAGDLVAASGLNLPTVDYDVITCRYPDFFTLIEHLRGMGESNCAVSRMTHVPKDVFMAAASIYKEMYADEDGLLPLTFQVIYMIGWAPHESQQKPKPRGSAVKSFKDLES